MVKFLANTIDPNLPEGNEIVEIFEGLFENGGVSKEPNYGRYFKGDTCSLGYFSYDTNN